MNRNWVDNFTMYSFLKFYFGCFFLNLLFTKFRFLFFFLLTSFLNIMFTEQQKKHHPKKKIVLI